MILPILLSIALVVCIALSALFSSAETGFLSINKVHMRHLIEGGDKRARNIMKLLKKPDEFFSTILIGNNLALVAASAIATFLSIQWIGEPRGPLIASAILTVIVLIFGEILPKTLFRQFADVLSYKVAPLLGFFGKLFYPFVVVFVSVMRFFLKDTSNKKSPFVTREEMRLLVKEGERSGALEAHERDMIHSIFSFGKTKVEDSMVPLTDVVVIDVDATEREFLSVAQKNTFTRIPVFDDRIDNVIGIVNVYEVLYSKKKKWQDNIREAFFVPESKNVGSLIQELQKRHERMCIVVGELGSPVGIVTIEDLMEEIVGDIYDEGVDEEMIAEAGKDSYLVNGKCEVEELNSHLGLSLSTDGFDTISGYVFYRLGRIPTVGEKVKGSKFVITVEQMEKNRILSVRLQLKKNGSKQ